MVMLAKVTTKGQVTIPVDVRNSLGLEAGDSLLFEVTQADEARIRVIKRRLLSDLYGALPVTRPYPGKEAVRAELGQQFGEKLNSQLEDQL